MREPLDLFISYASDDESLRKELEDQLSLLRRQGEIRTWHRREIAAGEEWRGQVDERLEAADLVLLLISPSFLASDYCYDDEANRALGRHARGEARVVPVIIRPCDWQHSRFAELEALPKGGEPVTAGGNRDQAWLDVVQGLRASIAALRRARGEVPERDDGRQPRYPDEESQQLSRQLKTLFSRRKALTLTGGDTVAVDAEILDVRRLLRKGPQLRPGEFLGDGRYELIEVVGQGGFATVWKAWDGDEEKAVALKVLHGHYSEDRGKRERFFRGARKMAELSHPNIVRVLEVRCVDDGWHFFVMEFLAGGNFEQAVLAGDLVRGRRLQVLLQVGEALEYAHQRGAVHRDVKPSNILLGEDDEAKLSDFDLVRAADTTGLTATRAMLGTVQFAAPEALESAGSVGPSADVYSLASTAVFAYAGGRLPAWYYRDPMGAIDKLDCGEESKRVLMRATSFNVSERPDSAADFCRDFEVSEMVGEPASYRHRAAEPPVNVPTSPPKSSVTGTYAVSDEIDSPPILGKSKSFWGRPSRLRVAGLLALAMWLQSSLQRLVKPDVDPLPTPRPGAVLRPGDPIPDVAAAGYPWNGPIGMRFLYAPAGRFQMGSPDHELERNDEEAKLEVELTRGFWAGETEVTQAQWREVIGTQPSNFSGCDDCPVENVTWFEAVTFANLLSKVAGLTPCYDRKNCRGQSDFGRGCSKGFGCSGDYVCEWVGSVPKCTGFRLPTEAEWEYVARAGTPTPFWTGRNLTTEQANYNGLIPYSDGLRGQFRERPVSVYAFQPNRWGLHVVHGNVWEWVQDAAVWKKGKSLTHEAEFFPDESDPKGNKDPVSTQGPDRVIRGGSWGVGADRCRSAHSSKSNPKVRSPAIGFRLVKTAG